MTRPSNAHDEVELKAVVADPDALASRLAAAGATLVFAGALRDRRYDRPDAPLAARDEVLRLRTMVPNAGGPGAAEASLDWKGPTRFEGGYKVREERVTSVGDAETTALILERAGFVVTRAVDREIAQYTYATPGGDVMLRIEWYPRMDVLLEVEGTPTAIERAIAITDIPRAEFTTASLAQMAADYERRTGLRARTSERDAW